MKRSAGSKELYLVWKERDSGEHIPVGRLEWRADEVAFRYLKAVYRALEKGMAILPEFPDIEREYRQHDLFTFFQHRVLNRKRPDFYEYVTSLGLDQADTCIDDSLLLERSEGKKTTDRFRLFRKPTNERGRFTIHCFVSGMTRSPVYEHLEEILKDLEEGETLYPLLEIQNPHDARAIGLKKDNRLAIGYVPRYYASELQPLLLTEPDSVRFTVERINREWKRWLPDVVLVKITGNWPRGWAPFSSGDYEPVDTTVRVPAGTSGSPC